MQVTELHRSLTLWLVNLLRYMIADRLSSECPQQQETDSEMGKELRLQSAHELQEEAEELVAKMCELSGSVVRYEQRISVLTKGGTSKKKCVVRLEAIDLINLVFLRSFPRF